VCPFSSSRWSRRCGSPVSSSFPQVVQQEGLSAAFELSVKLAVITTVLTIALMLPTGARS
jgi:hypothetical protein